MHHNNVNLLSLNGSVTKSSHANFCAKLKFVVVRMRALMMWWWLDYLERPCCLAVVLSEVEVYLVFGYGKNYSRTEITLLREFFSCCVLINAFFTSFLFCVLIYKKCESMLNCFWESSKNLNIYILAEVLMSSLIKLWVFILIFSHFFYSLIVIYRTM